MPNLVITEVALVHCNIVNNDYQQDSRVLHDTFIVIHYIILYYFIFSLINRLVNYYIFSLKVLSF